MAKAKGLIILGLVVGGLAYYCYNSIESTASMRKSIFEYALEERGYSKAASEEMEKMYDSPLFDFSGKTQSHLTIKDLESLFGN
ncbi:MAG: hypothetical protein WAU65_02220 [Candidatus Nanoarchaeia archaeon]